MPPITDAPRHASPVDQILQTRDEDFVSAVANQAANSSAHDDVPSGATSRDREPGPGRRSSASLTSAPGSTPHAGSCTPGRRWWRTSRAAITPPGHQVISPAARRGARRCRPRLPCLPAGRGMRLTSSPLAFLRCNRRGRQWNRHRKPRQPPPPSGSPDCDHDDQQKGWLGADRSSPGWPA